MRTRTVSLTTVAPVSWHKINTQILVKNGKKVKKERERDGRKLGRKDLVSYDIKCFNKQL